MARDPLHTAVLGERIALGEVPGMTQVHKFGSANSIGTSLVPVTTAQVYQTPTSAVSLEVVSSDVNDDAVGTGAQAVTVVGLDANFEEQTEEIEMDGTTPVALANTYTRVYRMYVSRSGTYATASASSHAGTITVRVPGPGATYAQIVVDSGFGVGQSQIGAYTVPAGKTAYLKSYHRSVETSKSVNAYLFQRPNADDVTTPFTGTMRVVHVDRGLANAQDTVFTVPLGPFVGPCDIGVMAEATATTANMSVDFTLYLVDTPS